MSLLCLLLKKRSRYGKPLSDKENVWCEYKVSVRVLLSVLFLMMSVLYILLLETKLYLRREREREICGENIGVFFFGFSSVVVLFFF